MIRWRSSAQLTYSGEQFADVFRASAQWSRTSHIPVDVTSAQEAIDHGDGALCYDLEVMLALHTGGQRELTDLATYLSSALGPAWSVRVSDDQVRCEFDLRRQHAAAAVQASSRTH